MTKYLSYFFLVFISACSNNDDSEYILIRDNLYTDEKGQLYLKSENNMNVDSVYDVWLNTVACEDCRSKNILSYEKELKDIVDVESFQLDSFDNEHLVGFYSDKNYTYVHKIMADGGVLNATKNDQDKNN